MAPARTLAREARRDGPGLFSHLVSRVTLRPAGPGTGIVFHRADLPEQPVIPARVGHVFAAPRKTVLVPRPTDPSSGNLGVHTVEHLLSALAAAGITDLHVEIFGAEVPMLDGSSIGWVEAVREAGGKVLEAGGVEALVVRRPVRVEKGSTWIEAHPLDARAGAVSPPALDAEYRLDYGPGAPIAPSSARFAVGLGGTTLEAYAREIAPARTFATLDEALGMRKMGLFSHLREGDTLVIGPGGPVGTQYRLADEAARHKVLDLIGDLALAGRPIVGRVVASQSGHALNQELAAALVNT